MSSLLHNLPQYLLMHSTLNVIKLFNLATCLQEILQYIVTALVKISAQRSSNRPPKCKMADTRHQKRWHSEHKLIEEHIKTLHPQYSVHTTEKKYSQTRPDEARCGQEPPRRELTACLGFQCGARPPPLSNYSAKSGVNEMEDTGTSSYRKVRAWPGSCIRKPFLL